MEDQNSIAVRVINIMRNALIKYAAEGKNDGVTPKDTWIMIALRPNADNSLVPYYRVWKNMEPYMRAKKLKEHPYSINTDEVSFKNILGQVIDWLGMEDGAKMFLIDTFARMQKNINEKRKSQDPQFEEAVFGYYEDENDPKSYKPSIEIIITTPENNPVTPVALLYYEGQQISQLDFSKDIFLMPTS